MFKGRRPRPAALSAALSGASSGGARAHAAGKDFEGELEQQHARWRRDGLACIQRGNPKTVRRPDGSFQIVGKGGVDFVGTFSGRPIAFDAKNRSGVASLSLKDAKSRDNELTEALFLLDTHRAGGLGFYLIRDPELRRVYLVHLRDDIERLVAGDAVRLRRDARGVAPLEPVVPFLEHASDHAMMIAQATGRDLWPWPQLLFPSLRIPQ